MAWGEVKDLPHCERIFAVAGLWLPGIVVFFGLLGTSASLFGLVKIRRYMGPTPSLLMITLSCLDLFILFFNGIRIYFIENTWPSFAAHPGYSRIPGLVIKRMTYTAYFCESWLVVLIAFNRFISICRPLYYGKANQPRTMRIVIGLLIVVSLLIHIPEYVTLDGRYGKTSWTYHPINSTAPKSGSESWGGSSGANKWYAGDTKVVTPNATLADKDGGYKNDPGGVTTKKPSWGGKTSSSDKEGFIKKRRKWWREPENQWFKTYLMVVDRFMNIFIPCVILVVLECFMVVSLCASRKRRKELMQMNDENKSAANDRTAIVILLSVAISYVVINVPNQIYSIWYWKATDQTDQCYIYRLVQNGTMVLNSSINFVLYYAMSSIFRRTLCNALRKQFCRRSEGDFSDGSSQGMMRRNSREMVPKKYRFNDESTASTKTNGSTV